MSPASTAYRNAATQFADPIDDDADPLPSPPPADPAEPGELALTPALTAAFLASLRMHRVHLKFFAGGWTSFDVARAGGPYDLLLTSETIYRPASLPALVRLLRRAVTAEGGREGWEDAAARLAIHDGDEKGAQGLERLAGKSSLCLVAAKLVYFGVGGGVNEFVRAVEADQGTVETIWGTSSGVRRSVMMVGWDH